MAEPVLLYCVGATKAGTSWLHSRLDAHPDCALSPVKELHYWDSFEPGQRDWQIGAFRKRQEVFAGRRAKALVAGETEKAAGLGRQIDALERLIGVIGGDRAGDAAYRDFVMDGAGQAALVADVTPAYGLVDEATYRRMQEVGPATRFLYLIRDPLARLWSHVRMQADRAPKPKETAEARANGLLRRIVRKGAAPHVTERGDYPRTVARLRAAVPAERLRIEFLERLTEDDRFAGLCRWLGIAEAPAEAGRRVHEGPRMRMDDSLREPALRFLRDHYDWAAREFGPLPPEWAKNHERALT